MNTGHEGGCGTVHANSAEDVPVRLEALGALGHLDRPALHAQLASALDVVVHIRRDRDGRRRVSELHVLERDPTTGWVGTVPALDCSGPRTRLGPGARQARADPRPMTAVALVCAGLAVWLWTAPADPVRRRLSPRSRPGRLVCPALGPAPRARRRRAGRGRPARCPGGSGGRRGRAGRGDRRRGRAAAGRSGSAYARRARDPGRGRQLLLGDRQPGAGRSDPGRGADAGRRGRSGAGGGVPGAAQRRRRGGRAPRSGAVGPAVGGSGTSLGPGRWAPGPVRRWPTCWIRWPPRCARDQSVERTVASELAGPRATGRVMAVLPLCGIGLGLPAGRRPDRVPAGRPARLGAAWSAVPCSPRAACCGSSGWPARWGGRRDARSLVSRGG